MMTTDTTATWILFTIISVTMWLIAYPVLLYYSRRFYLHQHIDLVAKRQPTLILMFAIVGSTLHLLSRTYFVVTSLLQYEGIQHTIANHPVLNEIMLSLGLLYSLLLNCVLWIGYFHYKKSVQLVNSQWQNQFHLLETIRERQSARFTLPWTLKYGKLLSSNKFLLSVAFVYWFCYTIIAVLRFSPSLRLRVVYIHVHNFCASPNLKPFLFALHIEFSVLKNALGGYGTVYYDIFSLVCSVIPAVPSLTIICITSKMYDTLGIKSQLRGAGIILYIAIAAVIISFIAIPFGPYRILSTYLIVGGVTVAIGIRMVYIQKLNEYINMQFKRQHTASMSDSNMIVYQFKDVWQNENLYQLFATHCCQEYSIETLLFIVEFEQFKRILVDSHEDLIQDSEARKQFIQTMKAMQTKNDEAFGAISDDILKVNRVSNTLTMSDCVHLFKYLYDQYVDPEGLIPVNISSETRDKVVDAYRKHHLEVVVENGETEKAATDTLSSISRSTIPVADKDVVGDMLMDTVTALQQCAADLYTLLSQDSWMRFRRTDEFVQFAENAPSSPKVASPSRNAGE